MDVGMKQERRAKSFNHKFLSIVLSIILVSTFAYYQFDSTAQQAQISALATQIKNLQESQQYYTGNPFTTELWSGQLQAENITGMHYYTYIGGSLYNRTDTLAFPESEASYIIFIDNSTIYVKNGTTGQIDYSGTNASDIIQNVINAVSINGGLLSFKEGTYNFDTVIYIHSNIWFQGSGWKTIFNQNFSSDVSNLIEMQGTSSSPIVNISFKDIKFVGSGAGIISAAGPSFGNCIQGDYVANLIIEDCYFTNFRNN